MISVEDYRTELLSLVATLPAELLPLHRCLGRTLAEPVAARIPLPAFATAATDGYAVRRAEIAPGRRLPVDGQTRLGDVGSAPLREGCARRIEAGAPVPAGADAIAALEDVEPDPRSDAARDVEFRAQPLWAGHIRRAGEDVRPGDVVVPAGTWLTPAALGAAASVGYGELTVTRSPRVAVLTLGDERVEPGEPLLPGQVPDSSGIVLAGLLAQAGAEVGAYQLPADTTTLCWQLDPIARESDLIVAAAGSAARTHALLRSAIPDAVVASVALEPGSTQAFGVVVDGGRPVPLLALPSDDVGAFVSFQVFVVPVLRRLTGRSDELRRTREPLATSLRSPEGLREYVPVRHDGGRLVPAKAGGLGSHLAASIARAEGFAIVPERATEVAAGSPVDVLWW